MGSLVPDRLRFVVILEVVFLFVVVEMERGKKGMKLFRTTCF